MTLRVIIVGAGRNARRHVRACRETSDVQISAVCDTRLEAARELAGEFAVPAWYSDVGTLLENEQADIAVVTTWGNSHSEITCSLARSGKVRAILCEKPFSLNAAEAELMCRVADEHHVLLAEAFKFRHHPVHMKAKELISAGQLGRVSLVHSCFTVSSTGAWRDPEVNWRFNPQRGGGAVYDLGSYCVHHARFVMGAEPERVYAVGKRSETSVLEYAMASMVFPGQRFAQWWVSFADVPTQTVEVYGSDGRLVIDRAWNNEDQVTVLDLYDGQGNHRERYRFEPVFQFTLQLQHLCDCLRSGQASRVPPENSVAQMRAIDALHESLRCGTPINVPSGIT